jgi:hypothetical protein
MFVTKLGLRVTSHAIFKNLIIIFVLTAIGLPPGGSSTVHIYTQQYTGKHKVLEECGPCPIFVSYTLAFALQLRKKHGKTSVRVAEECQLERCKQNVQNIHKTKLRGLSPRANYTDRAAAAGR